MAPIKMKKLEDIKIALVNEELTQLGGAERVLDVLLEMFPTAPIFTLVWDKVKTRHKYDKFDVRTSFIQKMPFGVKKYKFYLPLIPLAIEKLDLKEYDFIISGASALIKGVKTNKNQIHLCYCHTPPRYLWIESKSYIKNAPIPFFIRPFMPLVLFFLRRWDLKASKRPDFYLANSKNVQTRIQKYYGRSSEILYPPIETEKFNIADKTDDYFLLVSRIEPYKKVDMVVEVFNQLDKKLKIVGSGTRKEKLSQGANDNIEFIGRVSDKDLPALYEKAHAFIFPQEEDFGITALESMAAGRPVIAYKKGGALETMVEGQTGEFFYPQTAKALIEVIKKFNNSKYNPSKIRAHAQKFDKAIFKTKLSAYIKGVIKKKGI